MKEDDYTVETVSRFLRSQAPQILNWSINSTSTIIWIWKDEPSLADLRENEEPKNFAVVVQSTLFFYKNVVYKNMKLDFLDILRTF